MKIVLTGAFGRLGALVAEQALALGHELRCVDMETPATRKLARQFEAHCDIRFADLAATEDFSDLIGDARGVIHLAAMLPPATELHPALAERVNVGATTRLIEAIAAAEAPPHLIYPSSVSVFARTEDRMRPRHTDDPVQGTDNYTRHKLAVERLLQRQHFPWTILRVGASVDARTLSADRGTFRQLLGAPADTPVEWVHPQDVALAMCRCLEVPEARGRILLIGGGPKCQVTQAQFLGTIVRALGLRYPAAVHGDGYFYTHWMDTAASQALLQFQQHDLSDYEQEVAHRLRFARAALWPLRPLINPLLAPLFRRI